MVAYLRVSGILLADARLILRPSYLSRNPRGAKNAEDSPLQIEMRSGERTLLRWGAALPTGCSSNGEHHAPRAQRVQAKVPCPPETKSIVFLLRGIEIRTVDVPREKPELGDVVVTPRAGGWSIRWTARHAGKATMLHHVRASADGGKTWYRVGSRLRQPDLVVPDGLIVGGERCRVEVVSYDGVNTVARRVDVPNAPEATLRLRILAPSEVTAQPLALHAVGAIPGRFARVSDGIEYTWRIDGKQVGTGHCVAAPHLDAGKHVVTVEAVHGELRAHAEKEVTVARVERPVVVMNDHPHLPDSAREALDLHRKRIEEMAARHRQRMFDRKGIR